MPLLKILAGGGGQRLIPSGWPKSGTADPGGDTRPPKPGHRARFQATLPGRSPGPAGEEGPVPAATWAGARHGRAGRAQLRPPEPSAPPQRPRQRCCAENPPSPSTLLKERLMRPAPRRQRKQLPTPPPTLPPLRFPRCFAPPRKQKGQRKEAKVKRERRRAALTTYNWNRKRASSVSALRAQTKWRLRAPRSCFPLLPRSRGVCAL